MKRDARIFVAGALDPAIPQHLGYTATRTVEEAIAEAEKIHGPDCTIACVRTPQGA